MISLRLSRSARVLPLLLALGATASTFAATTPATQTTPTPQQTFATPEAAAKALIDAAKSFDVTALKGILGPDGVDLVVTDDPVQDKNQSSAFAAQAAERMKVVRDAKKPGTAVLVVGKEEWPGPIPIVEKNGRWSFDTKAGRQEILYRRIGRNELDAIEVCHGFVEAQHEYALVKHDGALVNQYAQHIISTPGKQDGLAWKGTDGTWEGPVGEAIARVIAEGYKDLPDPYHGYYYKVLKGQGPSAPMGEMDYVIKGAMIGGFALVATPANYEVTGVKTFIVSQDGVVYESDLGPDSVEKFRKMERYDPSKTWSKVHEP